MSSSGVNPDAVSPRSAVASSSVAYVCMYSVNDASSGNRIPQQNAASAPSVSNSGVEKVFHPAVDPNSRRRRR